MTTLPAATKRTLIWVLLAVAVLVIGGIAAGWTLFWLDLEPDERELFAPIFQERIPLIVLSVSFAVAFCAMAARGAFQRWVELPWRLAEDVRLLVPQSERRVELYGGAELQAVAEAVNDLAAVRQSLEQDVKQQIASAMRAVEEEKNRLAALMSELTQSVVVCNLDGRILLYNSRARLQFRALSQAPLAGGGEILGLGRSIYAVFERELITHALESIQARTKRQALQATANFVTTTKSGQLLRVQMAPVFAPGSQEAGDVRADVRSLTGYVLMLDNITAVFDKESKRDELLQSLTEGNRSALGNIRAAIEMLVDIPDLEAEQRDRFLKVIADEASRMSHRLEHASTEFVDALKARWPLEEMRGSDLIAAAARHIETTIKLPVRILEVDEAVWLKVDSFSVLQMLTYLASRLKDEYEVRDVRLRLAQEGRLAHIDLCWHGATMSTETVMSWEMEPMHFPGWKSPLTVREVIERCDGEIWFQRERVSHMAFFRVALPTAVPQEELDSAAYLRGVSSRPDYYDFNLFEHSERHSALDDLKLSEIAYTVFDTETTGLQPSEGDEIIQIGATRIVNGKLLRQEYFDQLIDPRRHLPASSTAVHGITPQMLVGQPPIEEVLPAFHAFAQETVLIAHNAAFDMRFLQLKEAATGCRFDQPVLDTLLLSAVIHPNQESHRLEAIAERFGIPIIGRHTALGDSIVTGEVFLRMIPLLAEKGIVTLRQAIDASQATYYARIDY